MIRFGRFEIDPRALDLRRDGERVPLSPQPVRLLAALAGRAGELVTREELYRVLWPDECDVDVNRALNTCVRQVRSALRQAGEERELIQTYPRRGYRFSPPPSAVGATPILRTGPRRGAMMAAALAVAAGAVVLHQRVTPPPRVVVLPLELLGGDEHRPAAEGVTESVLTALATVDPDRLRVLGWTPTPPGDVTPGEFARAAFGADYVVLGSFQPDARPAAVTARLVRTADGRVLWAERFGRTTDDGLVIPHTIAARVARSLLGELPGEWLAAREPSRGARIPYDEGRYLLRHPDVRRRAAAAPLLERAVAADPAFAAAHAALSDAYFWAARYAAARAAADRALALDASQPYALFMRGNLRLVQDWDWAGAERDTRRAVELAPGRPTFRQGLAFVLSTAGRHEEAVRELELAYELDPVSPAITGDLGYIYYLAGRYRDAAALCRRTVTLEPEARHGHHCAYAAYKQLGRWRDALRHAARLVEEAGETAADVVGPLDGDARSGVGRYEAWRVARLRADVTSGHASPFWLALALAEHGDNADALAQLERAADEPSLGFVTLRVDPRLRDLRTEPRFQALVRRLDAKASLSAPEPRLQAPNRDGQRPG